MITEKDRIEQFKRDLRSLKYYKGKIQEVTDELVRLARMMHEPKAVKYGERLGGNRVNYLDLMEKEDSFKKELQYYSFLVNKVEDSLNQLDEDERKLLIDLYVNRKKYESLAPVYYASERKLKYDVNEIIRKII